jgi:hypothetical protein
MSDSYFGDFQHEELILILSIPYRAGIWMSHKDDIELTERDDQKERMALEAVLERILNKSGGKSFVRGVVREIIVHKAEWQGWADAADTVLDDIDRAIALVDARLPAPEALQYRKCIFHVAKTVAMAAYEGGASSAGLDQVVGGKLLGRLVDWVSARSGEQIPANISEAERKALSELLQRLKDR